MSREKQFSEAEVLESVADLFASHGYQGTSLARLLDATGLGKQSLYNSFGDKRALYLKSVECSVARYRVVEARMQTAPTGRAALAMFFDHVVGKCDSDDPADKSCIVAAGLLEGVEDPLIVQTLRAKWSGSHEMLRAAVERGQKDGSISNHAPSAALADLLLAVTAGLRVNARAEFGKARLQQAVDLALSVLDDA
ncbi:MAG: TetR/AcrR family transcriptional regulator [Burkholderiaceae bacterium]|nr:TetR/AcrR family transcriptional regulator [Burkholderiaceae bacterium]